MDRIRQLRNEARNETQKLTLQAWPDAVRRRHSQRRAARRFAVQCSAVLCNKFSAGLVGWLCSFQMLSALTRLQLQGVGIFDGIPFHTCLLIIARAAHQIPKSPPQTKIHSTNFPFARAHLMSVMAHVTVQIERAAVVSGDGVRSSEEANGGQEDGMHGEQQRGDEVTARALYEALERMHGVLSECSWLQERVVQIVHVAPEPLEMKQAMRPVEPRVRPEEINHQTHQKRPHAVGMRLIVSIERRVIWLNEEHPCAGE